MMLYVFIHDLTGRVFKILPLKESQDNGNNVHVDSYVESLLRDVKGALNTFPELCSMPEYITVINIIQFFQTEDFSKDVCKQEVFKALRLLNKIEGKIGGSDE